MKNVDVLNASFSLMIKATLPAAQWSGRVRCRSLERLADADAAAKDKELLFLRDRVFHEMRRRFHHQYRAPRLSQGAPKSSSGQRGSAGTNCLEGSEPLHVGQRNRPGEKELFAPTKTSSRWRQPSRPSSQRRRSTFRSPGRRPRCRSLRCNHREGTRPTSART